MSDNPLRDAIAATLRAALAVHGRSWDRDELARAVMAVLGERAGPSGLLDLTTGREHEPSADERSMADHLGACERCRLAIAHRVAVDFAAEARVERSVSTPEPPPPFVDNRLPECVERWPDCTEGGYDPACCRFPKSCSCTVVHLPGDRAAPVPPETAP